MKINYGDIVQLGNHRLMCGDATNRDDVYKLINGEHVNLVLTDPPYGIKIHAGYAGYGRFRDNWDANRFEEEKQRYAQKHYKKIQGDTSQNTAREHYEIMKDICENFIMWGGNYFANFLPPSKCWLVWNKEQTLPNHSACELAYTSFQKAVKIYRHVWNGLARQGSLALNPKPSIHMTQKPVELHIKILEDFSKEGDVILDCFGGSGTTLIASECCNRKCLMMEISPEYCEIIIDRWEKLNELANKACKIQNT